MPHPEYYRGRLPHYHPPGSTLFVTTRLHGSLPQAVLASLLLDFTTDLQRKTSASDEERLLCELAAHRRYFRQYEQQLDSGTGPLWLEQATLYQHVLSSLQFQQQAGHYQLLAACVMPNHLHAVLTLPQLPEQPFHKTWSEFKAHTGRVCNRELARHGAFWQAEWYDRVTRHGAQGIWQAVRYTACNPVEAGLCASWQEWLGTWVRSEFAEELDRTGV